MTSTLHDYTGQKSYTPEMENEWLGDTLGALSGAALDLSRAVRTTQISSELVLERIDALHEMIVQLRDIARQRVEGSRR